MALNTTVTKSRRIRSNRKIKEMYTERDIVQEIKSQRTQWAGCVRKQLDSRLIKVIWKVAPKRKKSTNTTKEQYCDGSRNNENQVQTSATFDAEQEQIEGN